MKAYLERFRVWWAARNERERQILSLGGGALILILFYLAVWEPLGKSQTRRETALTDARELAMRLELLATQSQRGRNTNVVASGQSLLSVVDQSAKTSAIGKPPSRLQPEGDNTVRLWFEDVPFDSVLRWLNDLQQRQGVRVSDADIERESGSGLVNVRLTLVR